jgi:hypothetical protein
MPQNGEMNDGDRPEMPEGRFNGKMPQNGEMNDGDRPEMPEGGFDGKMSQNGEKTEGGFDEATDEDDSENSISSKGIKAENCITIFGGDISINSTDTCIKGNLVAVEGGTIQLNSSVKKGIKAMGDFFINDGSITVNTENEGIETKHVLTINGGNIDITANEDGINAGGNTGMGVGRSTDESNKNHSVVINGGDIKVSSRNDGIDSNGSLIINGGNVIVNGPTSGGDSAFDTDGNFVINGGYVLGAGSVGMVESPRDTSKQNVLNIAFENTHSANTQVSVKDDSGNVIFTFTPEKTYQSIIFSSDKINIGSTYTATAESESISATAESVITAIGNVRSGGFGGRDHMMPNGGKDGDTKTTPNGSNADGQNRERMMKGDNFVETTTA